MSMWGFVVNFALPPPLILTALLVLPTPRVVRNGLLQFTRYILFAHVVGSTRLRLVHFMLMITGAMFTATAFDTARIKSPSIDESPATRISMLGHKWRQERNFWIALLTFLLWALLFRLLHLLLYVEEMRSRIRTLEAYAGLAHRQEVPAGIKKAQTPLPNLAPKEGVEASAPPYTEASAPPAASIRKRA